MLDSDFLDLAESVLKPLGSSIEEGEEFRSPVLDVLRYYVRRIRLTSIPIVGRGLSVVAVVRQPIDLAMSDEGSRTLLRRLAMAVNGRFRPFHKGNGLSIGLTVLVTTPEPIAPEDDAILARSLGHLARMRSVPLGFFRVNLGQEAFAFALNRGPEAIFPEPEALAEALSEKLRRFANYEGV